MKDDVLCMIPDPAAPPVDTWPPAGTDITIFSALGREFNVDGRVQSVNGSGIRIRIDSPHVARFYPWSSVAFTQWEPPVVQHESPLLGDIEAEAAGITTADFVGEDVQSMLEEIGSKPAPEPWMVAWGAVACDMNVPEWFGEELHKRGFPLKRKMIQPAVTRDIIEADAEWPNGNDGAMPVADAIAGDDESLAGPDEDFLTDVGAQPKPKVREQIVVQPARYDYRVPETIADLVPDAEIAAWAAQHHTPDELGAIHKLHSGDFPSYMRDVRNQAAGDFQPPWFPPPYAPGEEPAPVLPPSAPALTHYCMRCDQPATWQRCTQFAGDHPYCDEHAHAEEDFGRTDDDSFYWEAIVPVAAASVPPDPQELPGDSEDETPDPGFGGGPTEPEDPPEEGEGFTFPGMDP